ncbi:MAG: DNA replication/repair protein RecF [Clostridia bacterium]|nr:DNA replication/repair protein RecF [Clostridia bacterium]
MKVKKICAEDFRNIERAEVEFSDGINLLFGANAQGKTNLLEAICYFSLGKSFRGAKDAEFIAFDKRTAKLSLDFEDKVRERNLTIDFSKDHARHIEQNGMKISRMSEIIGLFRAVIFCPEHLNIIKEGPSMRRFYLDVAISQLRPLYLRSLQRYNHILMQRNKLIKNAERDRKSFDATIEFWSAQLAAEAANITKQRLRYIEAAERELKICFDEMTGGRETPSLEYDHSFKIKPEEAADAKRAQEIFFSQLMSSHDREIYAGATLWGIHKDDLIIRLDGKNARNFASQGQQRSLALGLKLSEAAISASNTGESPVLLLDDVFSELDAERRSYLCERMKRGQVIMTACSDVDLQNEHVNVIRVENGNYSC